MRHEEWKKLHKEQRKERILIRKEFKIKRRLRRLNSEPLEDRRQIEFDPTPIVTNKRNLE